MKKLLIGIMLLNTIAITASANGSNGKQKDTASKQTKVYVVGEKDDYVYVQVSFTSEAGLNPSLQVTDGIGEVLYTEKISTGSYKKLLKFSTNELPSGLEINFLEKGEIVKTYTVNVNYVKTYALAEVAKN